jgi:chaperonin GroEL
MSKIKGDLLKQKKGIDFVVDAVKITIGPRGKNVSLSNGDTVNDARRVAEDIVLKDPTENKGANKVRNLVRKISSDVGGGRTAGAILYQNLVTVGLNLLNKGFNFNAIKKGMLLAVKDIHEQLDKMAQPSEGKLKQIATISTESEELGTVIADTMEKIGKDGIVTIETSNTFGISSERDDGLKFDRGYISPYMVTNSDRMEADYSDAMVFITDRKISQFKDIMPVIDYVIEAGKKNLFVIAEDFDGEALNMALVIKAQGKINTLAIKTPGIGDNKAFCIEDLCALTGATLVKDSNWLDAFEDKTVNHPLTNQPIKVKTLKKGILGKAKKVTSKKDVTTIVGNDVTAWITTLKTRKELTDNKWEQDQFNERIAKLQNGVAVIKVGASSEDEIKYLKLKIEDGVNECKRALEEGIVVGGDVAFIHASKNLTSDDLGYNIVLKSLEAPLRQIVLNGEGSPDVIVNEIKNSNSLTIGYDSLDNKIVDDMYKAGIIDAVKVTKTILKYAVDEAILFLSLGGDISEEIIETK